MSRTRQDDRITEPGKPQIIAYILKTGERGIDAARHYFPGVSDEDHRKLALKYNRWIREYRDRGHTEYGHPERNGRTGNADSVENLPGPSQLTAKRAAPMMELGDLDIIERLTRQLAELGSDLAYCRAAGEMRVVAQLDQRYAAAGAALDAAKERAAAMGQGVIRTPIGIQQAIADRAPLLEKLAERRRRNEVRRKNEFAKQREKGKTL